MIETYLSPGDIMQMYDDQKMPVSNCIDELTNYIHASKRDDFIDKYYLNQKVEELNHAFKNKIITSEEYLIDLYQLTREKLN